MTTNTPVAVGFIGVGDQGLPMAVAIAGGGFPLHVWARRASSLDGLSEVPHRTHPTVEALAQECDVVCLCVSTDQDVIDILEGGLLANLKHGAIVVNTGTGTPARAVRMACLCAEADVEFLDAPVSGGHAGAVTRTLTTMVGGPERAYRTCEPVFRTFSAHVAHLGSHGAGELAKLLNNTLMMMNHASVADILTLAGDLQVDAVALAEVLKHGSASSTALDLLPTGTPGLPADVVEHARQVLVLDVELFETAMRDYNIDTSGITARALSGANRVPNNLRILNP